MQRSRSANGCARQATQALREAGLVPPAGVDLTEVQRATLGGDLSDLPELPMDLRNWLLVHAPPWRWGALGLCMSALLVVHALKQVDVLCRARAAVTSLPHR